jgi:integrase
MPERFQIGDYWLSKRKGRKFWHRTWFDQKTRQTRRESLGTESYETAKKALAEWYAKHGELRKEAPESVLLDELLARYYEGHAIQTASAEQAYYAIQRLSAMLEGITVAEFDHAEQTRFITECRDEGLSDGYISRTLTVARAAINRAYKRGELASAPFVMSAGESPARDRVLSAEEMVAFLSAIDRPVIAHFCLWSLNTTARPSAILELKHFQVDSRAGFVALNPPGRKQTKKHRPTVPLTDSMRALYSRFNGSEYVIGKRLQSVKTPFRTLSRRSGVDRVTPYTLRHTMGAELRARGVPAWEAAGIMGHKIGGTTEIYAKYAPDYLSHARQAIDAYMGEILPHVAWVEGWHADGTHGAVSL